MDKKEMVTLGGREFPVAPLTLGQLRQAGPAFTRIGIDTPEGMGAQVTIIYLAMQAADPKVTPAQVDGIAGVTFPELKIAVETVARLMGVEMRAIPQGEAQPVAPENSLADLDWIDIYGGLMTACGFTNAEIDALPLPAYFDLLAYWRRNPPAHLLLKWFVGFKA